MTLKRRLLTHRDTHIKGGDDAFLTTDEIIHRLENLSADPTPSTDTVGRIFYNTAEDLVKYDTGSAIKAIGEGLGKRSATRIVAASNALQTSKDGADYVCDGTDDQVEINQAFDDIATSRGVVYLTEGDFYLSDSINPYTNSVLLGAGFGTVLRTSSAIKMIDSTSNTAESVTIERIKFYAVGNDITCININNLDWTLLDCRFETTSTSITGTIAVFLDVNSARNNVVCCQFVKFSGTNSYGVFENNTNYNNVVGNIFVSTVNHITGGATNYAHNIDGVVVENKHSGFYLTGDIKDDGSDHAVTGRVYVTRIRSGLDADLPAGSYAGDIYFATDTNKLYIWNGSAWVSTTLS